MQALSSKVGAPDQSKFYDNILGTQDGVSINQRWAEFREFPEFRKNDFHGFSLNQFLAQKA